MTLKTISDFQRKYNCYYFVVDEDVGFRTDVLVEASDELDDIIAKEAI